MHSSLRQEVYKFADRSSSFYGKIWYGGLGGVVTQQTDLSLSLYFMDMTQARAKHAQCMDVASSSSLFV